MMIIGRAAGMDEEHPGSSGGIGSALVSPGRNSCRARAMFSARRRGEQA